MELKQKQILITIWTLVNPECLPSVADRFNIKKSILFRVYRRICGAIANNLSGQYMKYPLISNWAPLGKMINFGSLAQRNVMDEWSNDPSLDHADQWSDESLSRVDLIDHWSENGFARTPQIRNPDPDSPKGTHPKIFSLGLFMEKIKMSCCIPFPVSSISVPVHSFSDVLKILDSTEVNLV